MNRGPIGAFAVGSVPVSSVAVSDIVTIVAAIASQWQTTVAVNDSLSLSESLATGQVAALPDDVTLTEAVAAQYAAVVSVTETVSVSASLSIAADHTADVAVSLTLTEAVAASQAMQSIVSDTIALVDMATGGFGNAVTVSETIAFTEALSNIAVVFLDTVSLTELLLAGTAASASFTQSLTFAESVTASYGTTVSLTVSLMLTEALAAVKGYHAGVSESVTLTNAIAATAVLGAGLTIAGSSSVSVLVGPLSNLVFELLPKYSVNQAWHKAKSRPLPDGTIPPDRVYRLSSSKQSVSLTAKHIPLPNAQDIETLLNLAASPLVFFTADGLTVSGIPISVSRTTIAGTTYSDLSAEVYIPS